jgi:HAD superfamily hydrolase (TIGR01509 family)
MQKKNGLANIKAVLFDLDGVLIDSYLGWYLLFNDALRHFGFTQISEETFRRHWGQSTEDDVRIFMRGRTVEEVRAFFQTHFVNYLSDFKINPSAQKTLKALLRSNIKLACVTNSHRDIARQILTVHQLDKYFKIVVTADDVKRPKPAPDMLFEVFRLLKIRPGQALFIGDTQSDKQAGAAAGCLFVGYKLNAVLTVDRLDDLYNLLRN